MMDARLVQAIHTVTEYQKLYVELGKKDQADTCDKVLDTLKAIAFDTAEIVSVTEEDDPELKNIPDIYEAINGLG